MKNKLTEHQHKVYTRIVEDISENLFSSSKSDHIEDRLLSLMGAAGTGKSFLTAQITKEIIHRINELDFHHNDSLCITAPTHKAVKVLKEMLSSNDIKADCRTLQSFLNIKPIPDYETGEERFVVIKNKKTLAKASLLIIDESSMISKELYGFIIDAIKIGRVNTVLFIGDPYQLLPVNSFKTDIFKLKKQYVLTQIVRQAEDSNIIKLATKIRNAIEEQNFDVLEKMFNTNYGEEIEFFKDKELFLQDYLASKDWHKENRIIASYTNDQVDTFNTLIRNEYWQEMGISKPDAFISTDMVRFKRPLNVNRISKLNNPTLYSNGDEVTINKVEYVSYDKSNMKFWKCTVLGRDERDFIRILDSDSISIFNTLLEYHADLAKSCGYPNHRKHWKDYFKLKGAFADVQYTYASTIHKLQGSTYDTAYIDFASLVNSTQLSDDLKYRLAYVAITRARKKVKILY